MSDVEGAGLLTDVVDTLKTRLGELFEEGRVIETRPLRANDPDGSLSIFVLTWAPVANSMEIGFQVPGEPTLQRYDMRLQNMVRTSDERDGRRIVNQDAKFLRAILYRDQQLAVRLRQINENLFNMVERVKQFGIRTQRFVASEVRGTFLYLATTEFWIETENTPQGGS